MRAVYDGIIGLAIGDALGVPVEFKTRMEIAKNPVVAMRAYGTHNQPMGTWSDDTSLTLALLDSLASKGKIDYKDIMDRFSDWLLYSEYTANGDVFDVGNSTRAAIINYGQGRNPLECGGTSKYENGNGSLMRILPIAYYLSKNGNGTLESQMQIVHNISSLTHRHPISLIGCGIYINVAMKLLLDGKPLYQSVEQGIKEAYEYYKIKMSKYINAYHRLENLELFLCLSDSDIQSSGYVVDTLEAALWCLLKTDSYKTCVLKAVNLGDDADTVGAVAGGLAGIYYGIDNIPRDWIEVIAKREYIKKLSEKL
ncbi:MAG: ADP-ribosylglycohydrolase family protein [Lachnospiraceae bacterium]